jgi:hypothetical protein
MQMWNRTEKKSIFKAIPVIRSCRPGDNLLSSSTLLPMSYNFLQNFKIVLLLLYIVKRYVTFIYCFVFLYNT